MNPIEKILAQSEALESAVIKALGADAFRLFDDSTRIASSFMACQISLDHARGLRTLMNNELPTPAIGLLRLQYESLLRSVWLLYAASESDVAKLSVPLNLDSSKVANKTAMAAAMLTAIDGKAPAAASQMLKNFKDVTMEALNSYVHGGIHVLERQSNGYPLPLLIQVTQSSNGLLTMAGAMCATLAGDPALMKRMNQIQHTFADCLPPLIQTS